MKNITALTLTFSTFLLLLTLTPGLAFTQSFKTENGHAEFLSKVPFHSFTGETDKLIGKIDLDKNTVDFYVDWLTVKTDNDKRDKDMYETVEAEKYPFIEFFGQVTSDFDPDKNKSQKVTVKGELKVHGVARQVEITGTLTPTDEGLKLTASWILRLKDYDIEPPGFLFYKVDNKQDVKVEALLKSIDD